MKLKTIFAKNYDLPLLGGFSIKSVFRWFFMAVLAGLFLFGMVRIPYVGGYIARGLAKVRPWLGWNQA